MAEPAAGGDAAADCRPEDADGEPNAVPEGDGAEKGVGAVAEPGEKDPRPEDADGETVPEVARAEPVGEGGPLVPADREALAVLPLEPVRLVVAGVMLGLGGGEKEPLADVVAVAEDPLPVADTDRVGVEV